VDPRSVLGWSTASAGTVRFRVVDRARLLPPRQDLLIALVLTVATQLELQLVDAVEDPFAVQVASFALITVAVAWRRAAPLAAAVVVAIGFAVQVIFAGDAPVLGGLVAAILVTYSLGAYGTPRVVALGALALIGGLIVAAWADADKRGIGDALGNLLIFGVILGLGIVVRSRRAHADALGVELRSERRRSAEILADERARIARELHDVIAHNVSLMVLQAGAARQVLDTDPERVREPLLTIEATGRQAIGEMRRLLGILRASEDADARTPQPGLARLEDLVAESRAAGVPVDLTRSGRDRPLPAGVDLAAYRIVQEALTNVRKHAGPGAAARVAVDCGEREITLEVADDGPGSRGNGTAGHGLVGMRERAALYGGEVEAATQPGGGFRVAARLPLDEDTRP
jgi:signal transduction histidine kinase